MENHSLLVLLGQAQYVLKAIGVLMVESTTAKDLGYCDDSHGMRIPSGLVVMILAYRMERRGFESAARRMLLSQKGFEYVIMKPALPAKAVGPQPDVSRSIIAIH